MPSIDSRLDFNSNAVAPYGPNALIVITILPIPN